MKDVAVLITTFLRDDLLFRCVNSIRKYYPDIAIYIGDNGHRSDEKDKFLKKHKCCYVKLPFDSGVGGTRNKAIKEIPRKYKYIAIVEDDIVFSKKSNLETLKTLLEGRSKLGIAGGVLKPSYTTEQHYEAETYVKDRTHYIKKIKRPQWKKYKGIRYYEPDLILNVFLAKRELFDDVQWDAQFKTAFEHSDFFLRVKESKWKVAYVPEVEMYHKKGEPSPQYLKYRSRPAGWVLFGKKWDVDTFYSDYNPDPKKAIKLKSKPQWDIGPKDQALSDAIEILNTHGIRWWLDAGTCLGVIRENDFIEHDNDIDIGIAPGQLRHWDMLKREFKKSGFKLYRAWTWNEKNVELSFTRGDVKLDLFFYRKRAGFYWHGCFKPGDAKNILPHVFPASLFKEPREINFKDMVCYVPNPPEGYLKERYGKDWRRPNRDYIYWRDCKAIDKNFLKKDKTIYISGSWDLFGWKHLQVLKQCKELGSHLIVGVVVDKACEPPALMPFKERFRLIESIAIVDEVIPQKQMNPAREFQRLDIHPDYLVYTGDTCPGREYIEVFGGKIVSMPLDLEKYVKGLREKIKQRPVYAYPQKRRQDEIAIGIKTLYRERNFIRAVEAIKEKFPFPYKLYIADDSPHIGWDKQSLYEKLEKGGHKIIRLPLSGISLGRNKIVEEAKEDYILMMDDDVLLSDPKAIENIKAVLDADDKLGLVAGVLRHEQNGAFFGNDNYSRGIHFRRKDSLLFREPNNNGIRKKDGIEYKYADQVVNFFLAKPEIFKDIKWDDRIRVEYEHMDFFLCLKETKWKAGVCLDAFATHMREDVTDPDWRTYRQHRDSKPIDYFLKKHGLSRVQNRW